MIIKIFKVSRDQVDQKWYFCSKSSPRQMIITLRIFHGFFQDWKSEKLWHWGVRPCRQKFLPLLNHRNFWTFRIFSKFFSEKSIFQDFDVRFFCGRGCAMTKIFFWGDRLFLEVKPRGRRKSRTGPPRGVINIFSSPRSPKIRKASFLPKMVLLSFFPKSVLSYLLEVTSDHPRFVFLKSWDSEGVDPVSRNFCSSLNLSAFYLSDFWIFSSHQKIT